MMNIEFYDDYLEMDMKDTPLELYDTQPAQLSMVILY